HCRYALGMEDGRISDEDLTASSRWYETTGPQYARLNCEGGDGAWCPEGQLEPSDSQYLQIDLRRLAFLTLFGTQGRYARGLGKEFAREYRLNYSRDGQLWKSWKDRLGKEVLEGNKNTYGVFSNDLKPPIIARYVRVIPVTRLSTTVCMRVELYGCPWEDGLVSYSAPEGQLMMLPSYPHISLNDSTYDGVHDKSRKLSGGLGQLTDGVTGQDNFLKTRQYKVWLGYDYLGWRNDTAGTRGYVEMEFVFDRLRNFTSMKVHSNNMFSRGVKIFSSVSCWFKPYLTASWEPEPVSFSTILDDRNPSARYVTVPLNHRTARSIRCRFYYADVWMMFSEVSFQSARINQNTDCMKYKGNRSSFFPVQAPRQILDEEVTVRLSSCSDTIILQTPPVPPRSRHPPTGPTNTDPYYERVFLLDPQYQNPAMLRNKLPELSQSAEASALFLGNPLYDLLLLTSCHQTPGWLPCGGGYAEPDITQCTPHQSFNNNAPHYAETDIVRLQGVTGSNMYAVPALTVDSLTRKDISAAEFPRHQLIFREKLGEGQFGEVDVFSLSGNYCTGKITTDNLSPPLRCRSICVRRRDSQNSSGKALPFLTETDAQRWLITSMPQQTVPLPPGFSLSRQCLYEIFSFCLNMKHSFTELVSVFLICPSIRNDFLKEIKIMSRLDDPNIIRLLCVCVSSDPLCMVTEYMENGDLNMFLSQREIESTLTHANNIPSVRLLFLFRLWF
ncbi:hypothetical protein GOODEAATRI_004009, partial [Goodea atripinnis]